MIIDSYYCDFKFVFNLFGYIPLDKLNIIDKSIRQTTLTLFIINFMNNLF